MVCHVDFQRLVVPVRVMSRQRLEAWEGTVDCTVAAYLGNKVWLVANVVPGPQSLGTAVEVP
jgi:ubiquinone biosynthesis protein UbiJ